MQYFNYWNSSQGIYDCRSFTESNFDATNINIVKSNILNPCTQMAIRFSTEMKI